MKVKDLTVTVLHRHTHTHTHTDRYRETDRDTHTHTDRQIQRDRQGHTHTHTQHTETQRDRQGHTHTHRRGETDTGTHTHTHTDRQGETDTGMDTKCFVRMSELETTHTDLQQRSNAFINSQGISAFLLASCRRVGHRMLTSPPKRRNGVMQIYDLCMGLALSTYRNLLLRII